MEKPKRTYPNAGAQTQLAYRELMRYGSGTDDDLLPVKTVSMILGISRNKVVQIPVARRLHDKRVYYRKGDVRAWMDLDAQQPDSLLKRLRADYAQASEKIKRQPSRRYYTAEETSAEAAANKKRTEQTKDAVPTDSYELRRISWTADWGRARSAGVATKLLDIWAKPKRAKARKTAK